MPLQFHDRGLDELIVNELGLAEKSHPADLAAWRELVELIKRPKPQVEVALVGKYIELPDAYLSVTEALRHAGWAHGRSTIIRWVDSESLTPENLMEKLGGAAGVVVPGGFGHRGIEGKVARRALRAGEQGSVSGPVPGPAMRRDRVCARRRRRGRCQLDRVRPVHPGTR